MPNKSYLLISRASDTQSLQAAANTKFSLIDTGNKKHGAYRYVVLAFSPDTDTQMWQWIEHNASGDYPVDWNTIVPQGFSKENLVGKAYIYPDEQSTAYAQGVYVFDEHRRQGIASGMYQFLQDKTGLKMRPDRLRSPEGKALWKGKKFSAVRPFERDAEFDLVGKELGIEYTGTTVDDDDPNLSIAFFQDPETTTSIGVLLKKFSPEQVHRQLMEARSRMRRFAAQMYNGGNGEKGKLVTYYTPNREMAESYVDMYNDRFEEGGKLHVVEVNVAKPAPWEVIVEAAKKLGFSEEEMDMYTPASIFDTNLYGETPVQKLVAELKRQGYDGTVLDDIAYGKQVQDKAFIKFSSNIVEPGIKWDVDDSSITSGIYISPIINGENAGTLVLQLSTGSRKALFVSGVEVEDKYRGTGLGQKLYDKAFEVAKKKGYRYVYSSNDSNRTPEATAAWKRIAQRYIVTEEDETFMVDLKKPKTAYNKLSPNQPDKEYVEDTNGWAVQQDRREGQNAAPTIDPKAFEKHAYWMMAAKPDLEGIATEVRDEVAPQEGYGNCQQVSEAIVEKLKLFGIDAYVVAGYYSNAQVKHEPHAWVQFENIYIDGTFDQFNPAKCVRVGKQSDPLFKKEYEFNHMYRVSTLTHPLFKSSRILIPPVDWTKEMQAIYNAAQKDAIIRKHLGPKAPPSDRLREEMVDPSTLIPTQSTVDVDESPSYSQGALPWIVELRGKRYIADGHHRVSEAINEGKQQIPVLIFSKPSTKSSHLLKRAVGLGDEELKHEYDQRPSGLVTKQEVTDTVWVLPDGTCLGWYEHQDLTPTSFDDNTIKYFCIREGAIWSVRGDDKFNIYKRPNANQMTRLQKMFQLNGGQLSYSIRRGPSAEVAKDADNGRWDTFLHELAAAYQADDRKEVDGEKTSKLAMWETFPQGVVKLNAGPVSLTAYRTGLTNDPQGRGVFFGDTVEGVQPYADNHDNAPVEAYQVEAKNVAIAPAAYALWNHLFPKKKFQDAIWEEDKKSGFKSSIHAHARVEARLAKKIRGMKMDAIIYTKPPAPAKFEVTVLNQTAFIKKASRAAVVYHWTDAANLPSIMESGIKAGNTGDVMAMGDPFEGRGYAGHDNDQVRITLPANLPGAGFDVFKINWMAPAPVMPDKFLAVEIFHPADVKPFEKVATETRTVGDVNRYLKSLGYKERLVKGEGYFYFIHVGPKDLPSEGVYVYRVNSLSLEEWKNRLDDILSGIAKTSSANLKARLLALRPQMAAVAQKEYDEWQIDEEGMDAEIGGGGICSLISNKIWDVLTMAGIECREGGQDGDDHSWTVAYDTATGEVYGVDIAPSVYETGSGYSWQKIPDVTITPENVDVWKLDIPINDLLEEY